MRLFILLLVLGSNLFAQSATELFEKASVSYEEKDYESAIELYQKLEELPVYSSDVYYNLANCYYKTHQKAQAVLYYEKALQIAPRDEDVLFNLKLVQLQLVDKLAQIPQPFYSKWMVKAKNILPVDGWAKMGLFFLLLFSILIIWFFISANYMLKKRLFIGFSLSLIISIKSLGMAYYSHITQQESAILMEANTYVKSAPSTQSEDLFILHEGTKILVLEQFNNWTKIKLSDGMIGWLESDVIEVI
jgi:tetratricopeptide (TPR) repeat protein